MMTQEDLPKLALPPHLYTSLEVASAHVASVCCHQVQELSSTYISHLQCIFLLVLFSTSTYICKYENTWESNGEMWEARVER